MIRPAWKRLLLLVVAAGLVVISDLGSNAVVLAGFRSHAPTWLLGTAVGIDPVRHQGLWSASQLVPGLIGTMFLLALVVVAGRYLSRSRQTWVTAMSGAALGGIVANNVDRVSSGNVTDWLVIRISSSNIVLNLADAAVLVGGTAAIVAVAWGLARR